MASNTEEGAKADDGRIELLLTQVREKDITELIASGREKLASIPTGDGGVAVAVAASAGGAGAGDVAPAAKAKKEEKVEEDSDEDFGINLFN